ncbi:hypothetical protein CEXT_230551 [Caerostris extrusa]|uniref:Uncharacterized protein n=1 Tax=Caerostris extrusa TaxID=172846 RepID=A0AAV4U9M1_CAEEX|nr:hypothetical protein CEXT_230551 [Caerostris extrusa]
MKEFPRKQSPLCIRSQKPKILLLCARSSSEAQKCSSRAPKSNLTCPTSPSDPKAQFIVSQKSPRSPKSNLLCTRNFSKPKKVQFTIPLGFTIPLYHAHPRDEGNFCPAKLRNESSLIGQPCPSKSPVQFIAELKS